MDYKVQRNSFAIAVQEKAKFYRERALVLELSADEGRETKTIERRETIGTKGKPQVQPWLS